MSRSMAQTVAAGDARGHALVTLDGRYHMLERIAAGGMGEHKVGAEVERGGGLLDGGDAQRLNRWASVNGDVGRRSRLGDREARYVIWEGAEG